MAEEDGETSGDLEERRGRLARKDRSTPGRGGDEPALEGVRDTEGSGGLGRSRTGGLAERDPLWAAA